MPARRRDVTGVVSGKLTAVRPEGRDGQGALTWLCNCECGGTMYVTSSNLLRAKVTSCGCHAKDVHKRMLMDKRNAAKRARRKAIATEARKNAPKPVRRKRVRVYKERETIPGWGIVTDIREATYTTNIEPSLCPVDALCQVCTLKDCDPKGNCLRKVFLGRDQKECSTPPWGRVELDKSILDHAMSIISSGGDIGKTFAQVPVQMKAQWKARDKGLD